jgi:hypothetical protein
MSCVDVHEGKACFKERMGRCHGMRIEDRLSALVCDDGGVFGSAGEDLHGQLAWGTGTAPYHQRQTVNHSKAKQTPLCYIDRTIPGIGVTSVPWEGAWVEKCNCA